MLEIGCIITTAPRAVPYLERTLASILNAGFPRILICAEPGAPVPDLPENVSIVRRPQTLAAPRFASTGRFGAWRNYVQSLSDALECFPNAGAIAVFQDDVLVVRDLYEFLQHDLWPSPNVGVVNVYTSATYVKSTAHGVGGLAGKGDKKFLAGACGAVYPRHVIPKILSHDLSKHWKGHYRRTIPEPHLKKAIDTWIGHVVPAVGLQPYFYNPSLVDHIGVDSSLKHSKGSLKGNRLSLKFPGEHADPFRLYGQPWVRYTLPSGHQRFANYTPDWTEPVAVVIPIAGECTDITERCLKHLKEHAGMPVVAIVIDNGCPQAVSEAVERTLAETGLEHRVIRNASNVGFTRAVNQGIAAAARKHVLILNNDTALQPGCLPALRTHLERTPKCGMTGPLTNDKGHQSLRHENRRRIGERPHVTEEPMLAFFCALLHKDLIRQIGPLDERFADGLGADDLYAIRAKKRGWKLLLCYDAYCEHLHSETFRRLKLDRKKMQREALAKLKRIPH